MPEVQQSPEESFRVLRFLRGIDLTGEDFKENDFPRHSTQMSRLHWLHLRNTGLSHVPSEIGALKSLEFISLAKNNLNSLHDGDLAGLERLRVLNCRKNKLSNSGLPDSLWINPELQVVDLSHNQLTEVPRNLGEAKALLVLNLSNNSIEAVPPDLFVACTDLMFLDLSNNQVSSLPAQLRRLGGLQTLILSNNPLDTAQLRSITVLRQLEVLHLANTRRRLDNFPTDLDKLTRLADVDLSENGLPRVPEALFQVKTLRKLNLKENCISELTPMVDNWQSLEYLNLSRNQLANLPAAFCKLTLLRKLYLHDNKLTFSGIPGGMGKLQALEIFHAARNLLENIPEGLCRCGKLKRLILTSNKLVTLPDAIHFLAETLEVFEHSDNPSLKFPPKPKELQIGSGLAFYNIDFSLEHQLRLAAGRPVESRESSESQPKARLQRLRRRRVEGDESSASSKQVLEGMKRRAREKERKLRETQEDEESQGFCQGKSWRDALRRPDLDYSKIFTDDIGSIPGVQVWEIEKFYPNEVEEEALIGTFYDGDCYLVLETYTEKKTGSLEWRIFYWIGNKSSLDKRACAAVHAVNLRNFLGAECRTSREEQEDESDEFCDVFTSRGGFHVIEGERTQGGFYISEEVEPNTRLYRLWGTKQVKMEAVDLAWASLDPKFVFLLDDYRRMYVWIGTESRLMTRSKARLIADKLNKRERKDEATIVMEGQGKESSEFRLLLGLEKDEVPSSITNTVSEDWTPPRPVVYNVTLGAGYLELPQVELPQGKLMKGILKTKNVYIIDCHSDVFLWIGSQSTKFVRFAGLHLSREICLLLERPNHAVVTRCLESAEPLVFKSKFEDWNDLIQVDYTRTADSVRRRGTDMNEIMEKDQIKTDLRALFMPREHSMPDKESEALMRDWNEELNRLDQFILQGKKYTRVKENEVGHFYNQECYIVLCRYWVPTDSGSEGDSEDEDEEIEESLKTVVYFWQGREASDLAWLKFNFSAKREELERVLEGEKEFKLVHQQREDLLFLSHFGGKFVVHAGKSSDRAAAAERVQFYSMRANGGLLTARCIEHPVDSQLLNSGFVYILKIPYGGNTKPGVVYVWVGKLSHEKESTLMEEVARNMYSEDEFEIRVISEEDEDNLFWSALGGRKAYDKSCEFMAHSRLFRLSNEQGFFSVSEKWADFCQDDLADDDVMLLDNGRQVFLWVGKKTSDVEVKLSFKSAQVYIQHLQRREPDRPRRLNLAVKNKENYHFRKCFHGWGPFKEVKDWSG